MSWMVILSVAASSMGWSLFDMSRKRLAADLAPVPVVIGLMALQTPLYAIAGIFEAWQIPLSSYWLPALASIVVNCLANVWFVESVRLAPFSLAVPILSLAPVFTSLGGFLFLDEPTTLRQSLGILIIVGSTFALARQGHSGEAGERAQSVRKGLILMALVALLWASTPVLAVTQWVCFSQKLKAISSCRKVLTF